MNLTITNWALLTIPTIQMLPSIFAVNVTGALIYDPVRAVPTRTYHSVNAGVSVALRATGNTSEVPTPASKQTLVKDASVLHIAVYM